MNFLPEIWNFCVFRVVFSFFPPFFSPTFSDGYKRIPPAFVRRMLHWHGRLLNRASTAGFRCMWARPRPVSAVLLKAYLLYFQLFAFLHNAVFGEVFNTVAGRCTWKFFLIACGHRTQAIHYGYAVSYPCFTCQPTWWNMRNPFLTTCEKTLFRMQHLHHFRCYDCRQAHLLRTNGTNRWTIHSKDRQDQIYSGYAQCCAVRCPKKCIHVGQKWLFANFMQFLFHIFRSGKNNELKRYKQLHLIG